MPQSTVQGHQGDLMIAEYEGKKILCWSGRLHRYEGLRSYEINYIAHMSAFIGCQYLLITCASGGGQKGMSPGTLMMITDFNNLTGICPVSSNYYQIY
jgi:purine-nucleoside phosphorylase